MPRRSATVYAAVARLSARHSTGFYLHCALPAIRALRAPLRQETKYKKMYLLSFNKLQKVHPLFVFLYDFLVFYSLGEVEHYFCADSRGAFDLHRVLLSII